MCVLAFLLGSLQTNAQSGPPQSNIQQQMTDQIPGEISGHVYRSNTGGAIPDATVVLEPIRPSVRGMWPQVATGLDGSFTFTGVAPGEYAVDASALDFLGKAYSDGSQIRPTIISIRPGQRIENIDIRLDAASAISGSVYDEDNQPIGGVMVTAGQPTYLPGGSRPMLGGSGVSSDKFGHFRISGLRPGLYYLRACEEDRNPGHTLTCHVTYYPGISSVESAQVIEVTPGTEISGIRFRGIRAEPSYTINATIADPQPTSPQRRYDLTIGRWAHNLSGRSSEPSVTFDGFRAGQYVLTAWAIDPASTEDGWAVSGRGYATVRIVDKDVHVEVPIGNGAEIRGKVIVEGARKISAAGTRIFVQQNTERGRNSAGSVIIDQKGEFTIRDIPPGRYTFAIPGLERSAYQKRVQCSEMDYTLKAVELDAGAALTECEITLSTDASLIQGQVLENGKPMPGMVVVMIPQARELRQIERYTHTTQSGSNGQFQLSAIAPGEYFLFAVPPQEDQSYYALDFADRNRGNAQPVSIRSGDTQVVSLKPSIKNR